MIDDTQPSPQGQAASFSETKETPLVAFCQQCGRGLTASSQRRIGTGIFCEPCAVARSTQPTDWTPVNTGTRPPYAAGMPPTGSEQTSAEPNPLLAGFLGLVPGVGAMYNGQYAKGVIHLIVFVVLVSLADNLNWVLWWFVWGWIFYQAFEAYHTAEARRDGHTLPDPFGWNELGERLGFARHWPPSASVPPRASGSTSAPTVPASFTSAPAGFTTPPFATGTIPTQVSENPYAAPPGGFASASSTASESVPFTVPPRNTGATETPYASTFTGSPAPVAQPVSLAGSRRFPVGAAWLIGLGILFLLGNLLPAWHLDGRWLVPILLAAIALWTGGSRLVALQDEHVAPGLRPAYRNIAGLLLGPSILLTVAVLLALQDASVILLRHSWPVLLIVWGGLLLLQRAADAVPQSTSAHDPVEPATSPVTQTPLR